ncbi:glycosyltransferase [Flavobacterium covae]|nr:glycosyltransferase [Flavobacterium covae]OWP81526.1 glycosyltransferase [Flavobacterium covae]POR21761.1 glycosyltransferase [Flavobacterium columnare]
MKIMISNLSLSERINNLKLCVIIPTYNNHKTLKRVIDGVLNYTSKLIVVNDGSTDSTSSVLKTYAKTITVVNLPKNKGKGNALKNGFKKALDLGYDYAITIDSDGQHYPDDIPVFVKALEESNNPVLFIGSRNMNHDSVPKKSSFGNRFSSFWFWFETGIQLTDTQSGYRLYPLYAIPKTFYTNKFEFEIEIIVRTAWNGTAVQNIPIQVLYDPTERVSHFRPFKDFTRISILNTILVLILFLYIKPRDFLRNFKKKSFKTFLKEDLFSTQDSATKKSQSIALGVFCGVAPFWGFQTAIVITSAVLLRLNKTLAFAFSNISVPPMIPIIIYSSLKIGSLFVEKEAPFKLVNVFDFSQLKEHFFQYLIGSFILAFITAFIFGVGSYLVLSRRENNRV